jgi:hypothetical protein
MGVGPVQNGAGGPATHATGDCERTDSHPAQPGRGSRSELRNEAPYFNSRIVCIVRSAGAAARRAEQRLLQRAQGSGGGPGCRAAARELPAPLRRRGGRRRHKEGGLKARRANARARLYGGKVRAGRFEAAGLGASDGMRIDYEGDQSGASSPDFGRLLDSVTSDQNMSSVGMCGSQAYLDFEVQAANPDCTDDTKMYQRIRC